MKPYKNKKASFYAEVIAQFFSYIVLVLVLIIFFVLFNAKGCTRSDIKQDISSEIIDIDSETLLLNYLRTPIEVNKEKMTFADLIVISYMNNNYDDLEKITKEYLDPVYNIDSKKNWKTWQIKIYDTSNDNIIFDASGLQIPVISVGLETYTLSTTIMPLPDNKHLQIEFSQVMKAK